MTIEKHAGGRPKKQLETITIPDNGKPYYTIPELCELTGLHRHTIQAKLRAGELSGKKISGTWRVYRDELTIEDA